MEIRQLFIPSSGHTVNHDQLVWQVVKDIETRTEDPEEKAVISRILEVKESSLSKYLFLLHQKDGIYRVLHA